MNGYRVRALIRSVRTVGSCAGVPMAFIVLAGDREDMDVWRGGGEYDAGSLLQWAGTHDHICISGTDVARRDLTPFFRVTRQGRLFHIEIDGSHATDVALLRIPRTDYRLYVTPGETAPVLEDVVVAADEVYIRLPRDTRPSLDDALRWARAGRLVYLLPREREFAGLCTDLVSEYTELRMSIPFDG